MQISGRALKSCDGASGSGLGRARPDGVSRRAFLCAGSLGGLSLASLLRAESQAGMAGSHKSAILIFLPGGPSHIDMYDLKPEAPVEIRGEFRPIATQVPGLEICEHLPRLAAGMERFAVIRSLVGAVDDHACHIPLTGWSRTGPQPAGGWPTTGAMVSRLLGPADRTVPPLCGLAAKMLHPPYNDPGPGFLGAGHLAFTPDGKSRENLVLNGVTLDRLEDRRSLQARFDRLRRAVDSSGMMAGMDEFDIQAVSTLTSGKLAQALDLSQESPRTRQRYGQGDPSLVEGFNAAPKLTEHFLMARRLVEAGARFVTLAFGAWDWHHDNFNGHRKQLPLFDQAMSALVEDLHERGLNRDVAVVAWGEFGRSPRINSIGGRDHWPAVSTTLMAGGGLRTGQAIGSTDRLGQAAKDRPIHYREVHATLYRHLGIDTLRTTLTDLSGRPQYLVDQAEPIVELLA